MRRPKTLYRFGFVGPLNRVERHEIRDHKIEFEERTQAGVLLRCKHEPHPFFTTDTFGYATLREARREAVIAMRQHISECRQWLKKHQR